MVELARKMPESSHHVGLSVGPVDLANEKHYSVIEISKLWALSQKTVRRIFEREPGVIHWGSEESRHKRGYRTLRVPETGLDAGTSKAATSQLKSAHPHFFKRS